MTLMNSLDFVIYWQRNNSFIINVFLWKVFELMWNMHLKCFLWDKDSVREMLKTDFMKTTIWTEVMCLFFIFLFSIYKKVIFLFFLFSLHGLTPNEPNKARDQTVTWNYDNTTLKLWLQPFYTHIIKELENESEKVLLFGTLKIIFSQYLFSPKYYWTFIEYFYTVIVLIFNGHFECFLYSC